MKFVSLTTSQYSAFEFSFVLALCFVNHTGGGGGGGGGGGCDDDDNGDDEDDDLLID